MGGGEDNVDAPFIFTGTPRTSQHPAPAPAQAPATLPNPHRPHWTDMRSRHITRQESPLAPSLQLTIVSIVSWANLPLAYAPPLRPYRYPHFSDSPLAPLSFDRDSASTPPVPANSGGPPASNIDPGSAATNSLVLVLTVSFPRRQDWSAPEAARVTRKCRVTTEPCARRRGGRARVRRESVRRGKVQLGLSTRGNVRDRGSFSAKPSCNRTISRTGYSSVCVDSCISESDKTISYA